MLSSFDQIYEWVIYIINAVETCCVHALYLFEINTVNACISWILDDDFSFEFL